MLRGQALPAIDVHEPHYDKQVGTLLGLEYIDFVFFPFIFWFKSDSILVLPFGRDIEWCLRPTHEMPRHNRLSTVMISRLQPNAARSKIERTQFCCSNIAKNLVVGCPFFFFSHVTVVSTARRTVVIVRKRRC